MLYRTFGKTKQQVSALGFGCMRLPVVNGGDPTQIDESKAIPMIRAAIDAGVNYVDTAYPYHGTGFASGGASEPFVGKALQDGYREKVFLATKMPCWLVKSREDMERYLNEQLERLQTDHIDFYLLHSLNVETWPVVRDAGVFEFLDAAIADGRIRYAGFSFHDKLALFKEIVDAYDWSFCQIQYNYLDEAYQAGTEGLQYAAAKGLGVVIMEPLRGGNLVNLPPCAKEILAQGGQERSPAEWGLRWVWDHPEVSVVLSGMNASEQVEENLRVASMAAPGNLNDEERQLVGTVKTLLKERIRVNCTACSYCMPCPVGINIPRMFSIYNDDSMFDGAPETRRAYTVVSKLAAPISACVECGKCASHCPQGIAIPEELKKVRTQFEG